MDIVETKQKMQKSVEFTREEVAMIRTGRANPALVENIFVQAYGGSTRMRVMEMASISVPEPQMIVLTPYDQSTIGEIRRDIEAANIGVNPVIDNNIVRLTFPALTQERRLEYVKLLHTKLEDGRVRLRQLRHEKMGEFKRTAEEGNLPEDDKKRLEKELQDLTDSMMQEIENLGKIKEKELMTV